MAGRIWSGVVGQLEDARRALRDAPVEVALGWIAAIALSVALEADADVEDWLPIGIAAGIAFPVAFAFSLHHAASAVSARTRWVGTAAGVAFAALYAFTLFDPDLASEVWRTACLFGAAAMMPVLVPLRAQPAGSTDREWFWLYNTRLAIRFVTVYGFAFLLALGLGLAVAAIGNLFDLRVPDRLYGHIAGLMFLALAPWALAGGVPDLLADPTDERDRAARHARRAGLFLALPLLLVYGAILYGYAIKIALTGEIPRNIVSPVVLGAGALWTLAAVALEPVFWDESRSRGVARLLRMLPLLMVPLLALGGWAIGLRVAEYGWTEFRYVRMVAVIALAGVALVKAAFVARGGSPPLRSLPIAAMLALLMAALGPLSAPAVAERSQRDLLQRGLAQADLRRPGDPPIQLRDTLVPPPAPRQVEQETYDRITGSAYFLLSHFGDDALDGLIEGPVTEQRWDIGTALGLEPIVAPASIRYVDATLPPGTPVQVGDAATLYWVQLMGDSSAAGNVSIAYATARHELTIAVGSGGHWTAAMDSMIERVTAAAFETDLRPRPPGAPPPPLRRGGRYQPGNVELTPALATIALHPVGAARPARLLITAIGFDLDSRANTPSRGLSLRRLEAWLIVDGADGG